MAHAAQPLERLDLTFGLSRPTQGVPPPEVSDSWQARLFHNTLHRHNFLNSLLTSLKHFEYATSAPFGLHAGPSLARFLGGLPKLQYLSLDLRGGFVGDFGLHGILNPLCESAPCLQTLFLLEVGLGYIGGKKLLGLAACGVSITSWFH